MANAPNLIKVGIVAVDLSQSLLSYLSGIVGIGEIDSSLLPSLT
jgi:hypothetical protein